MERSRRQLISGSIAVTIAVFAVLLLVLVCAEVAAQTPPYFVICKHEDLDQDREWTSMASDPPLNGWDFILSGPGNLGIAGTTSGDGCWTTPVVQNSTTYTLCEKLKPGWINSYAYATEAGPGGRELCTSDECCMSYYVRSDYVGPIEVLFGNYRMEVGGETEPASKLALLAPWLGLGAVILSVGAAVVTRRRRASSA